MASIPKLEEVLLELTRLKPHLHEKWGITELAVFGSIARGEATQDSDIDIMFDYKKPLGWEISNFGDFLEAKLQKKVDLLSKKAIRPKVWQFIQQDMHYA